MNAENSFKNAPQLQDKIADVGMTRHLLARYLKARKGDAIKLLNLNGVKIDNFASLKTVNTAFLKAIYASDSFRHQASQAMSDYALLKKASFTGRKYHNATDEYGNYYDDGSDPLSTGGFYNSATTSVAPATTTSASSSSTSSSGSSSSSGGSFWDTLGNIFSKDVIQSGIKTGLGALSTAYSSNANNVGQQNSIALEQTKLAEIQAAANLKATPTAGTTGLSTGWKIAIGVGVAAVLTTVIILIARKK